MLSQKAPPEMHPPWFRVVAVPFPLSAFAPICVTVNVVADGTEVTKNAPLKEPSMTPEIVIFSPRRNPWVDVVVKVITFELRDAPELVRLRVSVVLVLYLMAGVR